MGGEGGERREEARKGGVGGEYKILKVRGEGGGKGKGGCGVRGRGRGEGFTF